MAYDPALDEVSVVFDDEKGVVAQICSYNKGPKKMGLMRYYMNKEGKPTFTKIGRMGKDEVLWLASKMPEITKALDG